MIVIHVQETKNSRTVLDGHDSRIIGRCNIQYLYDTRVLIFFIGLIFLGYLIQQVICSFSSRGFHALEDLLLEAIFEHVLERFWDFVQQGVVKLIPIQKQKAIPVNYNCSKWTPWRGRWKLSKLATHALETVAEPIILRIPFY